MLDVEFTKRLRDFELKVEFAGVKIDFFAGGHGAESGRRMGRIRYP